MALHKLVMGNYGGKSPVSIKYENLHSFNEELILLCQSILETRRISNLHGSALFTIPLNEWKHFCRQFTLTSFCLIFFLLSAFFSSKPFQNNEMNCEIIDRYFSWNTTEKKRKLKCFLGAQIDIPDFLTAWICHCWW